MDVLSKTKGEDLPIFRAFVEKTLKIHADKLKQAQDKVMKDFKEDFWKQRKYITTDISLKYTHNIINRFVDMKRITRRGRKVPNVNQVSVHNKFILLRFHKLRVNLTYGLTEDVANKLREDIKNGVIKM